MKPAGSRFPRARRALVSALAAACLVAGGWPYPALPVSAAATGFTLPPGHDAYFVENDLVYRRFLELMHDGTYRQINQDRASCAEVDQGTWEQAAGVVRLHSVHHALRFRGLVAGPLCVVLDGQGKIDALPALGQAIRRFAASTYDRVFAARTAVEFSTPPAAVVVDPRAETFSVDDLSDLESQVDAAASAARTGVYTFSAQKIAGTSLLILAGDTFQAGDIERVRRAYHVRPGDAPPFYFALVNARTFAREVGTWQTFRYLGSPD